MYGVLIVDDQPMVRELLKVYIDEADDFYHVASISNAGLVELSCMQNKVDLILMDVCTQNNESGFEATAKIKKTKPDIKVVIITSMLDYEYIERAKKCGADSLWYKEVGRDDLLDVMRNTMLGHNIYPDTTPAVQIGLCMSSDFTPAELRVLRYLVEGMTYKEIASELYLSPLTIKEHTRHMLEKTGYSSKTKLAAEVASKKLIVNGF